jgi:carboxylate-amine ligase
MVDHSTRDLTNVADAVFQAIRDVGETDKVHPEFLRNTVEVVTGICDTVPEAMADLAETVKLVRRAAEPLGVDFFSTGTHPFAKWAEQELTSTPHYIEMINRTQYWGRQMLIWGVHVHVGVSSPHKVFPILNALLVKYPHLLALSASSPMWGGLDTGYASNRALLFQQLPTAGLPFQFETWAQFEGFVHDQLKTGVIDNLHGMHWDIRPSPNLGTIEVRVCDGIPTMRELRAITALIHCLVVDFDTRLEAGETLPSIPPWHVQENKWRAARYGLDAWIILDADSNERLLLDDLEELLNRLEPTARRLGCAEDLASVAVIPRIGASYQRQRRVAEAYGGDLRLVVDSLVAELRSGIA